MSDCLFCRIVEGEIPSKRIYEDETAVAFLDINPWQQGHALVIPRRHVKDVLEDPAALAEIAPAIGTVGDLLKERLGATACNILSNAGADSGQEVFHLHVHVLPRYADNPGISNMRGPVTTDLDQVHARLVGGE
ncbi:HIT family protein [Arachnia rubra]|jgi:histidine triad domain protein|uniref:HIT domain-containing protein n=1 Tax=Arachnia rubra TaxID=1547448 RepID=A0ABX7Y8M9_9ACTN|nr:HIT domain-containing protein [Arachnia rubra]MBB1572217.1 HIT domain-containing protein [Propionibacterium sp.]MDO4644989.1 HIT domain-containing protein [Propionibacteriaceae bacterium]MBB1577221.1 HIT domain-containing protein [Propionibacterium sp.]QUC09244.1 HIT domain-containing protein [Arachnia rubra]BCR80712.1 histidine triad protein [Arachnia rubra]